MSATKTSLQGGGFQDSEGNTLSNGYLTFELSQDSSVPGVGNVAAGIIITIQLDGNGNVLNATSPGQQIWANDVMLPVNTFYRVTGYTAAGQPAWGPNNQQVTGGSPFNLGSWVPNQITNWVPPITKLALQTNGVTNSSQSLLNIASGSGVTVSESGGTVTISSGSGGSVSGSNLIPIDNGSPNAGTGFSGSSYSQIFRIPGSSLLALGSSVTIEYTFNSLGGFSAIFKCALRRTLKGSLTFIDNNPFTFGGTSTPTFTGSVLVYTSDPITSVTFDSQHDYYFILKEMTGTSAFASFKVFPTFSNTGGELSGDYTVLSSAPASSSLQASSMGISQVRIT